MDAVAAGGASDPVADHHLRCWLAQSGTAKSWARVSGTCHDVCWDSGYGVAGVVEWTCDTYSQASWSESCVSL